MIYEEYALGMHFQRYLPKSNRFRFTFTFIQQHEVIAFGYTVTDCVIFLKNPVVGCFIINDDDLKAASGGNELILQWSWSSQGTLFGLIFQLNPDES